MWRTRRLSVIIPSYHMSAIHLTGQSVRLRVTGVAYDLPTLTHLALCLVHFHLRARITTLNSNKQ